MPVESLKTTEWVIAAVAKKLKSKITIKVPPFIEFTMDLSNLHALSADRDRLALLMDRSLLIGKSTLSPSAWKGSEMCRRARKKSRVI